jgi:hypothetical protein
MGDFRFSKNGTWGDFLVVESDKLSETIKYILENNIKNIELNYYNGYKLKNVLFLKEVRNVVEGLLVVDSNIELKGIEELSNLKRLNLSDELNYSIDLSLFPQLEKCSLLWHKHYFNLNKCLLLRELLIKKIKINKRYNDLFSGLTSLEKLTFIQSSLENLDFLSNFKFLNTLEIYYSPSLKGINGLLYCKSSLQKLILDHCKNIENYEVLSELGLLEFLGINDSKELTDLKFIPKLKELKHLSFVGTNLKDGDLSPVSHIKHVGFNNKAHYSHTYEQLKKD